MNRINSLPQNTVFSNNYKQGINNCTPSFKRSYKIAGSVANIVPINKESILKLGAAILGSLGILKVTKGTKNEPEVQIHETKSEAPNTPVKYDSWEELQDKIEEAAEDKYNKAITDAKRIYAKKEKAAEEKRSADKAAAEAVYKEEYEALCIEITGGNLCDLESYNHEECNRIKQDAINECRRVKSIIDAQYKKGEITREEYNIAYNYADKVCNKAYDEVTAKYQAIETRIDAIKKKRWDAFEKADNEYYTAKDIAKTDYYSTVSEAEEQKKRMLVEYDNIRKTNISEISTPMTVNQAVKVINRRIAKQEKLAALEKAEQEKKVAKKNAQTKKMIAELEEHGFTNIKESSNGFLYFDYEGITYKITNDKGYNADLYKSLLNGIQGGAITRGTSIQIVVDSREPKRSGDIVKIMHTSSLFNTASGGSCLYKKSTFKDGSWVYYNIDCHRIEEEKLADGSILDREKWIEQTYGDFTRITFEDGSYIVVNKDFSETSRLLKASVPVKLINEDGNIKFICENQLQTENALTIKDIIADRIKKLDVICERLSDGRTITYYDNGFRREYFNGITKIFDENNRLKASFNDTEEEEPFDSYPLGLRPKDENKLKIIHASNSFKKDATKIDMEEDDCDIEDDDGAYYYGARSKKDEPDFELVTVSHGLYTTSHYEFSEKATLDMLRL